MKKTLLLLVVLAITVALVTLAIGAPSYNVKGTKHNLSTSQTTTWRSTNEDQICVFCHTPHNGWISGTPNQLPLWNKQITSFAGNYGAYGSNTMNATPGTVLRTGVGGWTKTNLCMSCHDGTMAVNTLVNPSNDIGSNPTMAGSTTVTSAANLGTDLTNDHPVNFTYDVALATADGGLVNPTAGPQNPNGLFATEYSGKNLSDILVPGGLFSCSSCHEPHVYYGGAYTGYSPFLIVPNTGSGLCLSCHLK